jgi:hypothetical protein
MRILSSLVVVMLSFIGCASERGQPFKGEPTAGAAVPPVTTFAGPASSDPDTLLERRSPAVITAEPLAREEARAVAIGYSQRRGGGDVSKGRRTVGGCVFVVDVIEVPSGATGHYFIYVFDDGRIHIKGDA